MIAGASPSGTAASRCLQAIAGWEMGKALETSLFWPHRTQFNVGPHSQPTAEENEQAGHCGAAFLAFAGLWGNEGGVLGSISASFSPQSLLLQRATKRGVIFERNNRCMILDMAAYVMIAEGKCRSETTANA